jgi:hypothetical protein
VPRRISNVYADLSGLAVGFPDIAGLPDALRGYVAQLETWISYLERFDRLLYGSDWPLVNPRSLHRPHRLGCPRESPTTSSFPKRALGLPAGSKRSSARDEKRPSRNGKAAFFRFFAAVLAQDKPCVIQPACRIP